MAFVAIVSLSFNSCSKSDDDGDGGGGGGSDKIIGTWKSTGVMIDGEFYPNEWEPCETEKYKFKSNKTAQVIDTMCDSEEVYTEELGEWENLGDNEYYLDDDIWVVTFSENNTRIEVNMDGPDNTWLEVFEKQ